MGKASFGRRGVDEAVVLSGEWRSMARKMRSLKRRRRSNLSVDSINIQRNRVYSVGISRLDG